MIDPWRDFDRIIVYNARKLSHGKLDNSPFAPCLPNSCLELIKGLGIRFEASTSFILGQSETVNLTMTQLLLCHNSTTTVCHSRTQDIDKICKQANIVVKVVGQPLMVKKS